MKGALRTAPLAGTAFILALGSLTAGFLIAGSMIAGPAARAEEPATLEEPPLEDPAAFKSPLKDRPLFSPTRAPPIVPEVVEQQPEEAPPVVVEETPPPPWRLVGVVKTGSSSIAIFAVEGGASFRLRQGDERDGWQLAEVGRREAVLQSGERTHTVKFAPGAGGAAAPAPRRADPNPAETIEGDGAIDPNQGADPNVPLDPNGNPIDPSSGLFDQNGVPIPMNDALRPRRDGVRKVGERPRPPAGGAARAMPTRPAGETGEVFGGGFNDPSLRDGGDGTGGDGTGAEDGGLLEGALPSDSPDGAAPGGTNQ